MQIVQASPIRLAGIVVSDSPPILDLTPDLSSYNTIANVDWHCIALMDLFCGGTS